MLAWGCSLAARLGLLEPRACEHMQQQEAALDTLVYLKLLFVPTLGLIILALFLLEEYCYCNTHSEQEAAMQQAAALAQQAQQQALQQADVQIQAMLQSAANSKSHTGVGKTSGTPGTSSRKGSRALLEAAGSRKGSGGGTSSASASSPLQSLSVHAGGAPLHQTNPSSPYPHPLTLLSLARTPAPSVDYPIIAGAPPLCNPQDLLAGAGRAARLQATMAGSAAAQGAQTLLLGAPALLPVPPSAQWPQALRVNMLNEAGVSTIVTVPSPSTTIRELCLYYAQKNNSNLTTHAASTASGGANGSTATFSLSHSLYVLRYRGTPLLSDKATLASVGLVRDLDVLHVSLDWSVLHSSLRGEMAREVQLLARSARAAQLLRSEAERQWKERVEMLERAEGEGKAAQTQLDADQARKVDVQHQVDDLKSRLAAESAELTRLSREKLSAEGSDLDRIEHKRYEKLHASLAKEMRSLESDMGELTEKMSRVEKERDTIRQDLRELEEKKVAMEEEVAALAYLAPTTEGAAAAASSSSSSTDDTSSSASASAPAHFVPFPTLLAHFERLDRAHTDLLATQRKVHFIVQEIAHKKAEIQALNKKVAMSAGLNVNVAGVTQAAAAAAAEEVAAAEAAAAAAEGSNATADGTANPPSNAGTLPPSPASSTSSSAKSATAAAAAAAAASVSATSSLDHSLASLRARAAALEKDTRELVKWKSIAKHLEQEGKESARWKALAKAAQAREKSLEQMLNGNANAQAVTAAHSNRSSPATVEGSSTSTAPVSMSGNSASKWRARARAFETEMRELRAWKRAIDLQNAAAAGSAASGSTQADFYAVASPSALANSNITYDMADRGVVTAGGVLLPGVAGSLDAAAGVGTSDALPPIVLPGDGTVASLAATLASDDENDPDRIEPQQRHLAQSEEEELLHAAKMDARDAAAGAVGAAPGAIVAGDETDPALSAHQRISAELLAAEAEEERLVQSMRLRSTTPTNSAGGGGASSVSSPSSIGSLSPSHHSRRHSSAAATLPPTLSGVSGSMAPVPDASDDDDLFRLGEALVRRNQHLQQHRLMVRYQQQQLAMQHMQREMEQMQMQQQQQQHMHQIQQQQEPMHSYSASKAAATGVLQASAPVFTPRFHTDASPMPLSLSSGGVTAGASSGGTSKLASHYTKVGATSPFTSLHTSPSLSPSPPNTGTWSTHVGSSSGGLGGLGASGTDIDPSAYWLHDSASSILDSHSSTGAAVAPVGTRHRSYSNPSSMLPPSHLNAMHALPPSHPAGASAFLGGGGSGTGSGTVNGGSSSVLSGLSLHDPFTSFRHSQNLTIIDDGDSDVLIAGGGAGMMHQRHSSGGPSALSHYQSYGGGGFGMTGSSSSGSRVHSDGGGASPVHARGSSSLFGGVGRGSGDIGGGQLPAFLSLSQQQNPPVNAPQADSRRTQAMFHATP